MGEPIVFTLSQLIGWILAFCGAVITIAGAVTVIVKVVAAARKPNEDQNTMLEDHERRIVALESADKEKNKGYRVMFKALIALLDHGLDGNNVDQMKRAKDEMQEYLVNE